MSVCHDFESLFQQALNAQHRGALPEAIAHYQRCLACMPEHGESLFNLGVIKTQQQAYAEALHFFDLALRIYPMEPKIHFNTAIAHLHAKAMGPAVYHLQQTLIHNDKHGRAHHLLACLHAHQQQWQEAKSHYIHALALMPEQAECHANYALCCMQLNDYQRAQQHLEQACALTPTADYYYNLAYIAQRQCQREHAEQCYLQALRCDPTYFDAHYQLTLLYKMTEQPMRARYHCEQGLAIKDDVTLKFLHQFFTQPTHIDKLPANYVTALFDAYSEYYDDHCMRQMQYTLPDYLKKTLAQFLQKQTSADTCVLDLGCGTGLLAAALRPYATSLIGVDLSPSMLSQAKKTGHYDVCHQDDAFVYCQSQAIAFDGVLAAELLSYIGDSKGFFDIMQHCIKPKGWLIFTAEESACKQTMLNTQLRFTHATTEIMHALTMNQFIIHYAEPFVIRKENNKNITVTIYCCRRQQ